MKRDKFFAGKEIKLRLPGTKNHLPMVVLGVNRRNQITVADSSGRFIYTFNRDYVEKNHVSDVFLISLDITKAIAAVAVSYFLVICLPKFVSL